MYNVKQHRQTSFLQFCCTSWLYVENYDCVIERAECGEKKHSLKPQLTMNYERDWKWKNTISLSLAGDVGFAWFFSPQMHEQFNKSFNLPFMRFSKHFGRCVVDRLAPRHCWWTLKVPKINFWIFKPVLFYFIACGDVLMEFLGHENDKKKAHEIIAWLAIVSGWRLRKSLRRTKAGNKSRFENHFSINRKKIMNQREKNDQHKA